MTNYPFDAVLNSKSRSKETDWVLQTVDGAVFVEYFEGRRDQKYLDKVEMKREICRRNNIRLIEIWREDLSKTRMHELLGAYKR